MSIVTAPLNITVGVARIRVQPQTAPFQIINTNLTVTVWAANNPSVVSGVGTSIPPGTSLTWTSPGDVYLIRGNDAPSVAGVSADVIISYDVVNWTPSPVAVAAALLNSGVIIIDSPTLIMSQALNGLSSTFDVSRYNSLDIHINSAPAGATLTIFFYSDISLATTALVDKVQWVFTGAGTWYGSIPIRSKYMVVFVTGGPIPSISIYSSNRLLNDILTASFDSNNLLLNNTQTIGAGVGATVIALLYFGEIEILTQCFPVAAGNSVQVTTLGVSSFLMPTDGTGGGYVIAGSAINKQRLVCWGQQASVVPISIAAATTFRVSVSPVQPR